MGFLLKAGFTIPLPLVLTCSGKKKQSTAHASGAHSPSEQGRKELTSWGAPGSQALAYRHEEGQIFHQSSGANKVFSLELMFSYLDNTLLPSCQNDTEAL